MRRWIALMAVSFAGLAAAQQASETQAPAAQQRESQAPQPQPPGGFKQREPEQAAGLTIAPGTHVLLSMINSVSTKEAQVGDRIYLETAFPVLANGRIVIPQGSWVTGTITELKRATRMQGRGSMRVRFDSLTLPNGVSRDFRSDLGAIDPRDGETLKRENSTVTPSSNKGGEAATVAGTTAAGTLAGAGIGSEVGHIARGSLIGAGAGAAAGGIILLVTKGHEAVLNKGSSVEMVLDRSLTFQESELDFSNVPPRAGTSDGGSHGPAQQQHRSLIPGVPW